MKRILVFVLLVYLAPTYAEVDKCKDEYGKTNTITDNLCKNNKIKPIGASCDKVRSQFQEVYLEKQEFDYSELNDETIIVLVSAYQGGPVEINLDLPRRNVFLILPSNNTIEWKLNTSDETNLIGVIVSSDEGERLLSTSSINAYEAKKYELEYAYDDESRNFRSILRWLNTKNSNVKSIDYFYGAYDISGKININKISDNSKWTLDWPVVEKTNTDLEFSLMKPLFGEKEFTITSPLFENPDNVAVFPPYIIAVIPEKKIYYQIEDNGISKFDLNTWKKIKHYPLPTEYEKFSHTGGIAYDSKNKLLAVVSSGGDGGFYRFDVMTELWKDYRSFNGLLYLDSLSYDKKKGYFVVSNKYKQSITFLTSDGRPIETHDLRGKLKGIYQTYDSGNEPEPTLSIVPLGDEIVILLMNGASYYSLDEVGAGYYSRDKVGVVKFIWYYNKKTGKTKLAYRSNER